MAYRRDSTEKISYAAPPQSYVLRYGARFCAGVWVSTVYVVSPFDVIAIGRSSHLWIKCELKMIVRIDQPWQNQKPAKIKIRGFGHRVGQGNWEHWKIRVMRLPLIWIDARAVFRGPIAHRAPRIVRCGFCGAINWPSPLFILGMTIAALAQAPTVNGSIEWPSVSTLCVPCRSSS